MNAPAANFDRLARVYRALETIAFGRDLERARFCFLDRLKECQHILVLGEGDGRCLARLVKTAPRARIRCIDASLAMLGAANRRLSPGDRERVDFTVTDARAVELPAETYDAVTTLFFLDCFPDAEVEAIVANIAQSLRPGANWLFADFVLPARGVARWRAQAWLTVLYTFFRWQTGLSTRRLPHSESLIERVGFAAESSRTLQYGLLRTTVYRRADR